MRLFNSVVFSFLTFAAVHADQNSLTQYLYNEGKTLLNQQEHSMALQIFESVVEDIERTNCTSPEDQACYLSAAFNAALLSANLQDLQNAERYQYILAEASSEWLGSPLHINSRLVSQNTKTIPNAFLNQDRHAWGTVFICSQCGAMYTSRPNQCYQCSSTSFIMSEVLPPGAR